MEWNAEEFMMASLNLSSQSYSGIDFYAIWASSFAEIIS